MSAPGNSSSAVKNQRAPASVSTDDATRALWRQLDWFATPPWATRAVAEMVRWSDPKAQTVWEPACGDGIMSETLSECFAAVYASDIHPQTPQRKGGVCELDFLKDSAPVPFIDWIITNPPFALAKSFAERALTIARRGVALLCRLNWLESAERHELFRGKQPLHACYVFSERVPMQLGPWNPRCSSATAYAWFIWRTHLEWQPEAYSIALGFIPPGTRARLTRPDDVRRFCKQTESPLID